MQKGQVKERGLLGGPCISPDYRVCNLHWGFYGKDGGGGGEKEEQADTLKAKPWKKCFSLEALKQLY